MTAVRIVGAGRAGQSFSLALAEAGVEVELVRGRGDSELLAGAAHGVDAVLIAVPDRFVATVSAAIEPDHSTAVLHCSGSLGLDALGPESHHHRRGSIHPLATLPDPVIGSMRLRGGTFFAVSGDQAATDLALVLGGQPIVVAEDERARYHAAACVAANHVVALLGQVERIAAQAGLPLEAFVPLTRGALDDVTLLGPTGALTGPAARGDEVTLAAHRAVLAPEELAAYDAGVSLARRLAAARTPAEPPVPSGHTWS